MRWDAFFGDDNVAELQWRELSVPENRLRKQLQLFLDLVEQRLPVAALPRVRKAAARVDWYIGWRSESDARFAADLLFAFLGRTYARLDGPIRRLDPSDAAETAFAEEFDGRAFRVEVSADLRTEARDQLLRLARCLSRRNVRHAVRVRPVGRILRDLEFALQNGEDGAAISEIGALRAGGHLDEANLAFLDLRRLAAKRDWAGIFAHEALPSVLALGSLPSRVRNVLLEAVYHRDLAEFVEKGEVDDAIARFADRLPHIHAAVSSRKNVQGIEADVCFLLADDIRRVGAPETTASALTRIQASGRVAFAEAFRSRLVRRNQKSDREEIDVVALGTPTIHVAQRALIDGDLDRAFITALEAAPSQQRVKILLQCARLLDDEMSSIEALKAWDALSDPEQAALRTHVWCKAHYDYIKAELGGNASATAALAPAVSSPTATPSPTCSWLAWFERLRDGAAWPGAVARASKGVADWSVASVLEDPQAVTTIVDIVEGTLVEWASEALRQSLPYLLEAFVDDTPDARLSPVFSSLFDLLATDDALTLSSISALIRLSHARLSTSPSEYRSTLAIVADSIEQADTPRSIRIIADALEMLITTPCAALEERTAAATRLLTLAVRWWPRVDELDRALVRQLATELGAGELVPPEKDAPPQRDGESEWNTLAGLQIAFYSLNEGALERATSVLGRACPAAKLKVFREFGGTEPMKEAARMADLFVIATKSAKHAATDAITHNRPADKATEFASGKGSTSLLDAVRRWLHKRGAS